MHLSPAIAQTLGHATLRGGTSAQAGSRGSVEGVSPVRETFAELRAKAKHLRELVRQFAHDGSHERIMELADELDARAAELEEAVTPDAADP